MVAKFKYHVTQWGLALLPFILTALLGMTSYTFIQINKSLDSKASQESMEGWAGIIMGITGPAQINGIEIVNIIKINGIA